MSVFLVDAKPLQLTGTGRGLGGGGYFIVMEYLTFKGRATQEELGRGLAQMHLAEPTVSLPSHASSTRLVVYASHA